ncbi:hypothetical protein Q8G47_28645, partial [Klebsiella pneumoniae]|uniref:hypothetical protein n=1 Tax=Klebsiella pneumoniae TaxID=573 RepID=UPI0030137BF9
IYQGIFSKLHVAYFDLKTITAPGYNLRPLFWYEQQYELESLFGIYPQHFKLISTLPRMVCHVALDFPAQVSDIFLASRDSFVLAPPNMK